MATTSRNDGFRPTAYPAILLFAGMAFGAWVAFHLESRSSILWSAIALTGIGVGTQAGMSRRGSVVSLSRLTRYAASATLAMGIGGLRMVQFDSVPADDVSRLLEAHAESPVRFEGRTVGTPVVSGDRARFVLNVDRVHVAGHDAARISGQVYVRVRNAGTGVWVDAARNGSRIQVAGVLQAASPPRNPADFDFRSYLRRRGIRALLSVNDTLQIQAIAAPTGWAGKVAIHLERRIEAALHVHVPSETGRNVLAALLLGRRSEIDQDVLDRFARTGLMHVLAVSGLHVVMVGMVVYGLLCPILLRLGCRWRTMEVVRAGITVLLLTLYGMITGGSASVTRAVVMAAVLIGGVTLQRNAPSINSLAVAGCVLLLQRPTFLWDVGFQLSFMAVAAIILLNRPVSDFLAERMGEDISRHPLLQSTTTTVAATIGTAPVLLYHFGSVSGAGLFLNPIAIPSTGMALMSGLLTVVSADAVGVARAFGNAADVFVHALVWTASVGDQLFDWARLETRVTYLPYVLAMILFAAFLVVIRHPVRRWRMLLSAMIILLGGIWYETGWGRGKPSLDVLFLDVGQGDAALVRFPNGRHLLVDLGPRDDYFDAGARVVIPQLQWMNVRSIDAAVVSHPHADHLGGLPALLRTMPVGRVIDNGDDYDSSLFDEVETLCDSLNILREAVSAGDTLLLDPRVRVYVLGPTGRTQIDPDPNERSVVLLLRYGAHSILLTGDAEDLAERELLHHFGPFLDPNVVKVAHHGSGTSSMRPFVRRVTESGRLDWALISVGRRNRFGLPDESVVERWATTGARVHQTATAGALWLRSDGRHLTQVKWLSE